MSTENKQANPAPTPAPTSADAPAAGKLAADKLGVVAIAFFVDRSGRADGRTGRHERGAVLRSRPRDPHRLRAGRPHDRPVRGRLPADEPHITNAGGFVAYIAKGLGNRWATGGAGLAILPI